MKAKYSNQRYFEDCFIDDMKWFTTEIHFTTDFDRICCCSWWTFWTPCLNGQLLTFIIEAFELLTESCAKFNLLFVNIFNMQLHVAW